MSDQIHRTTLNRICRYGKNGVDFDFDPHLVLLQFKDLYSRKDMKLVSFRVARLYAGKTKQLITPSFVVYKSLLGMVTLIKTKYRIKLVFSDVVLRFYKTF